MHTSFSEIYRTFLQNIMILFFRIRIISTAVININENVCKAVNCARQGRFCPLVHWVYATVRRPVPVDADTWWVDWCHCWRDRQVDQCGSLQDMSTRPRPHMASQGYAWTVIAVFSLAFQQVAGYWLLPFCVQACCGSSPAEEGGAWW